MKSSQPLNTPAALFIHLSYDHEHDEDKGPPDNKKIILKGKIEDLKERPVKKEYPKKKDEEPQFFIAHYSNVSRRASTYQYRSGRRPFALSFSLGDPKAH
jgi:hypothetical protein